MKPTSEENYHEMIGGIYKIRNEIGRGSFSVVKLVEDIRSNQLYACKVVPIATVSIGNETSNFEKEIRIVQQLHHPGIVQLYDLIKDSKFYYIIMELCPQGDLFRYIIKNQRLSELEAKYILKQLFEALQYLHSLAIVHRDLKPENLFFDESWRVKIGDFGLSRFVNAQGLADTPCGSICYASPECITGTAYDGRKRDVWSVGVIAYAMLAGFLPWTKKNQKQLIEQIQRADFLFPPFFSEGPKDLIAKMLTPDPCQRISVEQCLSHPWIRSAPSVRPVRSSDGSKDLWISLRHVDKFFGRDDSEEMISINSAPSRLSRSSSTVGDNIEDTLKKIAPKQDNKTARQAARTIVLRKNNGFKLRIFESTFC